MKHGKNNIKNSIEYKAFNEEINFAKISKATAELLEKERIRRTDFSSRYKGKTFLMGKTNEEPQKQAEIKLPAVGDVSAGKSSLMNALCKFPISPVANTTTSACPVEIRYARTQKEERLEVARINEEDIDMALPACYTFNEDVKMNHTLFKALYNYAVALGKTNIIQLDDTLSYFDRPDPSFLGTAWPERANMIPGTILYPENPRHVMHLLMLLLATYVDQDKPADVLSETQKRLLKERKALMEKLHIPTDIAYVIRLYWHSDQIPEGTAIIDLPGLGATAQDGNGQMAHDKQVEAYLSKTPSLLFMLGTDGTIQNDSTKTRVDNFIDTNKEKASPARVLFVINKADTQIVGVNQPEKQDEKVQTTIGKYVQPPYEAYRDFPFYAISARSGEWLFEGNGVPLENMFATRDLYPFLLRRFNDYEIRKEESRIELKMKFEQEYACRIDPNTYRRMNLQTFIRNYFSDQVGKMRLLQAADEVERHFERINTWADAIKRELTQLNSAKDFGKKAIDCITDASVDALKQTFNKISAAFQDASNEFVKCVQMDAIEITGCVTDTDRKEIEKHPDWNDEINRVFANIQKYGSVLSAFEKCDENLSNAVNKTINDYLKNDPFEMRGDVIPIDDQAAFSFKAKNNYARLVKCGEHVSKLDFIKFFDSAFKRLRIVFERDQKQYAEIVKRVIDQFEDMPKNLQADMDKRFDDIWNRAKKDDWDDGVKAAFRKQFDRNVTSVIQLTRSLYREIVTPLEKDKRLECEINETLDRIREALSIILAPYTSNFGYRIFNDVRKGYWISSLDRTKFDEFIQDNYIQKFRQQLDDHFKEILYGGHATDDKIEEGHAMRIMYAVDSVQMDYMDSKRQEEMCEMLQQSIESAKDNLATPEKTTIARNQLLTAGNELKRFFESKRFADETNIYFWLTQVLMPNLGTEDWASTALAHVMAKANEAKASVEDIQQFDVSR